MAGWKVRTWPPTSGGTAVRSETDPTSIPSAARWSRVPSVANSCTSRRCSSRANAEMPSRLATESSARTCSVPPRAFGRALRSRRIGDGSGPLRAGTSGGEYSVGPWHTRLAQLAGRGVPVVTTASHAAASETCARATLALGIPVQAVQRVLVSRPVHPADGRLARRPDRDGHLLQHPHAPAPPAQRVPADVRVDPVDGGDHLRVDARLLHLPVRHDHRALDAAGRP